MQTRRLHNYQCRQPSRGVLCLADDGGGDDVERSRNVRGKLIIAWWIDGVLGVWINEWLP